MQEALPPAPVPPAPLPRPPDWALDAATYEIRIVGPLPPRLLEGFDDVTLSTTPTQTVLLGSVENQAALCELLDDLQDLGLVPTELHRLPGGETGLFLAWP